jgi:predicted O-methyltransferase YrrM
MPQLTTHAPLVNAFLLLAVLATACYAAHKARRVHLKLFELERMAVSRIDNLFTQFEALIALYHDLDLGAGLPATRGWASSPDFLRHMARVAAASRPATVVECSSGTSTIVLARVMQLNGAGHVYSLEHDPKYAAKTRTEIARQGLNAFATIIDAPLRTHRLEAGDWLWYETRELPPSIDILVVDGPPMSTQALARYPAVPLLNERISRDGRILLDDADRADEVQTLARWESDYGWIPEDALAAEKGAALLKRRATSPTDRRQDGSKKRRLEALRTNDHTQALVLAGADEKS